jgi:hypothetical protein
MHAILLKEEKEEEEKEGEGEGEEDWLRRSKPCRRNTNHYQTHHLKFPKKHHPKSTL